MSPFRIACRATLRALLLALGALLLMGTSRPLAFKTIQGKAMKLPPNVKLESPPELYVGENVNNQGCFRENRADAAVKLEIENLADAELVIREKGSWIEVGGRRTTFQKQPYTVAGKTTTPPLGSITVPGHGKLGASWSTEAFAGNEILDATSIEVGLRSNRGGIHLRFTDLDKAKQRTGRGHPTFQSDL